MPTLIEILPTGSTPVACTLKNMTIVNCIVNDATSWSVTLELSIMLPVSPIMLLENIHGTGFTYNRHLSS